MYMSQKATQIVANAFVAVAAIDAPVVTLCALLRLVNVIARRESISKPCRERLRIGYAQSECRQHSRLVFDVVEIDADLDHASLGKWVPIRRSVAQSIPEVLPT